MLDCSVLCCVLLIDVMCHKTTTWYDGFIILIGILNSVFHQCRYQLHDRLTVAEQKYDDNLAYYHQ